MTKASATQAGFTIVETLIFLTVTGVLLMSALLMFNGRIGRTRFSQAVQSFDTQLKTTINEVSSGNYPATPAFTCTVNASGVPQVAVAGAPTQGANQACIFVGKVVQAGVQGEDGCTDTNLGSCISSNTYMVVGRRTLPNGQVVSSYGSAGAQQRLANGLGIGTVDLTNYGSLAGGMYVSKIVNLDTNATIGAVGIFQSLGSYSTDPMAKLNSGSQSFQLWPIGNTYPMTKQQVTDAVANSSFAAANANPANGILFCLTDGAGKATISLGSANGSLTTTQKIGEDSRCGA